MRKDNLETFIFILKSIILGIVEGATEFLPVSSTGHLIIFQNLIGFESDTKNYVEMYTYVIQLGAILAVVVLYKDKIFNTLRNFFPKKVGYEKSGFRFWLIIFIACIPGGILGILLDDVAEKYFFNIKTVSIVLILGGIAMIIAENKFRENKNTTKSIDEVTPVQAIKVGMFQSLAIIPGMSRSASTIIGGWVSGFSTVTAAEFSFFLAIPVMIGMSGLKIVKMGGLTGLDFKEMAALIVGFIFSFIVALIVVEKFITFLQKRKMRIFAVYRIIFGSILLILGYLSVVKF